MAYTYNTYYTYSYGRPVRVVTPLEYAIDTIIGVCFMCCFICAAIFGKRNHHHDDLHHDDHFQSVTVIENHCDPNLPNPNQYPPTPPYGQPLV